MQIITGDKTLLPIGLTVAVVLGAMGGTWAASGWASRVTVLEVRQAAVIQGQEELVHEMKEVNKTLAEILVVLDRKHKP